MNNKLGFVFATLLCGCQSESALPVQQAELLGSNAAWGNTEGPAIDSKGTLYFTARGSYKGIVAWTDGRGFEPWLEIAKKEGPGGLYIDDADNLYVTATGEQQILKVAPGKQVSVIAENFDAMPGKSKGPNDLVVTREGTIYFTEPNGYDGSSPKGTIYRIPKDGKAVVFSQEITGPNGVILSQDQKTLYASHNVTLNSSQVVRWRLNGDGTSGPAEKVGAVEGCQADGMDLDQDGNFWLTCYSHGAAYLMTPGGKLKAKITTAQPALTNCIFGRGANRNWLYFTSSDMARVTGYVYRARTAVGGIR